ncbi:hypothetical protein P872_02700 [Rhodonellum psychrophilum GCM71 = DSM 17998]|uniref:HTH lacI-type domain-containing protein n=2 Tax=Rhodonellum TaxID=336827 RepID=U5C0X4_9BACT|nr:MULTISPECIES: LacI family DNA-binding transcriptional regulator [Rhodonellum]ERM83728.1 hypothetical protein P872_02700 [Rhodonellum psychrophilum GCM71 = DSM 17998]SDY89665.1 transcriptional regulator, LacI family [Rhodonellum ikkaensis]
MAKKKISIKDIAKELGVSITTVSFVINGKAKEKRISDVLTLKVEEYIKEVNYKPSHLAQSLRSGKSKVIVFMVEDISNYFFSTIAKLIEEKAYVNGYKIIYCSTENKPEKAKEMIETFKNRNVDGFIITPTPDLEVTIQELLDEDFPVVLFDRWLPAVDCNYVIIENEKSAADATAYLIKTGCKYVGFVTLDSDQNQMQDRLKGYVKTMLENGFQTNILKMSYEGAISERESIEVIQKFIQTSPKLDSILFATNFLALKGLAALKQLNSQIPSDISIVTFDDHFFFNLYQPKITAIEQPLELIAEKLMEGILLQLKNDNDEAHTMKVVLPTKFHIRESTMKIEKD